MTAAIVRWLRLEAAAHSVRSLTGRLEEPGPRSGHREIERVLDAARVTRYCTDAERRVLRARYWPRRPHARAYDMRVAGKAGGTVVVRAMKVCWPSDGEIARALGLRCAGSARALVESARSKVRQALEADEGEAACA